jgi:hypothetical protein
LLVKTDDSCRVFIDELEMLDSSSPVSASSKRPRMSDDAVSTYDEDIVMGSQSGEEETYPSPRHSNASSSFTQKDSQPDTTSPTDSAYDSLFDGPSHDSSLFGPTSVSRDISPPPAEEPEEILKPITAADKTAQIIANIKARAYAQAVSSPESEKLPELAEIVEASSDDEEDELQTTFRSAPKKSKRYGQ